jgi:hypothetical protein
MAADVYGEAGNSSKSPPFQVVGVGGNLSTTVNKQTGVSQIFRANALNTQQSLGTYDPKTKKFVPQKDSNGNLVLTDAEIKALSNPNGITAIDNAAKATATKGIIETGTDPQVAQQQANKLISPNSSSPLPTGQEVQGVINQLDTKPAEGTRDSFPKDLRYPSNLKIESQDVIKFTMLKYEPKSFTSSPGTPIPGGISDTNSVSWGEDRMTPAQLASASVALTAITKGGEAAVTEASNYLSNALKDSKDLKTAIAAGFAEQATGVSGLLTRTAGVVTNPNLELLFQGPSLRPFNFSFKLSARGTDDREYIRKIIRFFKQGMAVQRSASNLFLKSPHTFKIQYLHGRDKDHPYINYIKECALQSFTVNYTPEGNYMTFSDGLMTSYEISMQFQELEPIFNDDYSNLPGGDNDDVIGY